MKKLNSVLTPKKKEEILKHKKSDLIFIINIISGSTKIGPNEKMRLIESLLIMNEIIDIEHERIRYELLCSCEKE